MRTHADLQRSVASMSFGLGRQIAKKTAETAYYGLGEREAQYQFAFNGMLGDLPVENKLTINFDLLFLADAGNMRDSTLDRPQVRFGWEEELAPAGTLYSAKVSEWLYDQDLNFIGAIVTLTAHCPAVAAVGMTTQEAIFKASVHIGFQGFCVIYDSDSGYTSSGNSSIDGGLG